MKIIVKYFARRSLSRAFAQILAYRFVFRGTDRATQFLNPAMSVVLGVWPPPCVSFPRQPSRGRLFLEAVPPVLYRSAASSPPSPCFSSFFHDLPLPSLRSAFLFPLTKSFVSLYARRISLLRCTYEICRTIKPAATKSYVKAYRCRVSRTCAITNKVSH